MRKVIAFLLLAGAAAPALAAGAADDRHGGWRHDNSQQQSSDDNNNNRSDRPRFNRIERNDNSGNNGNDNARVQSEVRVRPQFESNNNGGNNFRGRFNGDANANVNVDARARAVDLERIREARGGDNNDSVRNWHGRVVDTTNGGSSNGGLRNNWRGRVIENPNVGNGGDFRQDRRMSSVFRNRMPVVSDQPREGTQPRLRVDSRRQSVFSNWSNNNWRHDGRYDWQNWRRRHGSIFHLGFYYDPFGWDYRPYQVGWRLWPSYYQQNYWLNDPWQYRLPYAPPGTQWIRYYNDALLVDTWNGEVVDVIYNFFW